MKSLTSYQMILLLLGCTLVHSRKQHPMILEGSRNKGGEWRKETIRGKEYAYLFSNGLKIFEGDIIIPDRRPADIPDNNGRNGDNPRRLTPLQSAVRYYWPNGYIPYEINGASSSFVSSAIAHWESKTVLKFGVRNGETDYVSFIYDEDVCASYVGRIGGKQNIWIAPWCEVGGTIHEIGHAIGMSHTHSREDRDNYISLSSGWESNPDANNFEKRNSVADDCGPYDYGSIMHYSTPAFGVTIKPINTAGLGDKYWDGTAPFCDSACDPGDGEFYAQTKNCWIGNKKYCVVMGQRDGLSDEDIQCVNAAYLQYVRGSEKTSPNSLTAGTGRRLATGVVYLQMQGDGNLVLYNNGPKWATGTNNGIDAGLGIQNDGNLVVYQSGVAKWASNTNYGSTYAPYILGVSSNGFAYLLNKNNEIIWSVPRNVVGESMPLPTTPFSFYNILSDNRFVLGLMIICVFVLVINWVLFCSKKKPYEMLKQMSESESENENLMA